MIVSTMRVAFGSALAALFVLATGAVAQPVDPQRLSEALDLITQAQQDMMESQSDKALVELTQAINMDVLPPTKQAQALTDRGTLLEGMGQIQDARGDYRGALRLVPGFAAAKARLSALTTSPIASMTAPSKQVAAKPPALSLGIFLQVGSYKSEAMATQAWTSMQQKHSDIFNGLSPNVMRIDLGNRGIWYRLRASGFAEAADASALCERLKAEGGHCLLTR